MESLLSSPARLANSQVVENLKVLFCFHGALGARRVLRPLDLTEVARLRLVPLVFGLMPRDAFIRPKSGLLIKPLIRNHLAALGCKADELLVDVLKSVCDQYYETRKDPVTHRFMKKKYGLSDVRAMPKLHQRLISDCGGRCSLCGARFDGSCQPTLDHIVPWRLIGDVVDGANWQLLCDDCNGAKGSFLSSLQSPHALNWVYGGQNPLPPLDAPSGETRFVVLSQVGSCEVCGVARTQTHLHVRKRLASGLALADNLAVVCDVHAQA